MLLNCGVAEDSWEFLGLQGLQTSPSWRKSVLNIHWKDWCWRWSSNILATWCKEPTHVKRPWCWERLKAGGEGDDRGWDGWHHWLDGHEFEQAPGVGDGQGGLACCSPWGCKELDTTEQLNWTELNTTGLVVSLKWENVTFLVIHLFQRYCLSSIRLYPRFQRNRVNFKIHSLLEVDTAHPVFA